MPENCDILIRRGSWAEDTRLRRCRPPIGPRNTISNIAYALAGWAVACLEHTRDSLGFAGMMTLLAAGSALYHAFKTRAANKLDHVGMYAVFSYLVLFAGLRYIEGATLVAGVLVGTPISLFLAYRSHIPLNLSMGGALALCLLAACIDGHTILAATSFLLFTIGYTCWALDRDRSPLTGLWGHALWHICTAAALGAMYLALAGKAL